MAGYDNDPTRGPGLAAAAPRVRQIRIDYAKLLESLAQYVEWRGNLWATWTVLESPGRSGRYA